MAADTLIAPYQTGLDGAVDRRWEGRNTVKPWQRKITATFAHLETPQLVGYVIALLRLQTVRPHIIVVDTGSTASTCRQLEEHRAEDVEIHYVRSHGYQHSSAPVGVACDLAQALCQTEYMFWTHSDCFLRSRSYLEERIAQCGPQTPVVGYQMSDRSWLTDQWAGMFSHTATVTHMPTWYRLGVTWSFERSHEQFGIPRTGGGWPDTETAPNLILRAAGVAPVLIGDETNYERQVDENRDHFRSFGGSLIYAAPYHAKAQKWMRRAMREADTRIARWTYEQRGVAV